MCVCVCGGASGGNPAFGAIFLWLTVHIYRLLSQDNDTFISTWVHLMNISIWICGFSCSGPCTNTANVLFLAFEVGSKQRVASTVSLLHTTRVHTDLPARPAVRRCVAASIRHVGVLFLHPLHRHLRAELDQQASH